MTKQLDCIKYPAKETVERVIIWMHGLGADYNDFLPVAKMLTLSPSTEVIFPNAPIRSITLNHNAKMRAWYDIADLNFRGFDEEGTNDSTEGILSIYQEKIDSGIPAEHILFAGFSQGGAMALHVGTCHTCAGILALSCYLLDKEGLQEATESSPPILMLQGTNDPIVGYSLALSSADYLYEKGYKITFKRYPMRHEVSPAEIRDIGEWLNSLNF